MKDQIRNFLCNWLIALYEQNHPNYKGSAYLSAMIEEGTIAELKEAIAREIIKLELPVALGRSQTSLS